jgi:hypothetical protein
MDLLTRPNTSAAPSASSSTLRWTTCRVVHSGRSVGVSAVCDRHLGDAAWSTANERYATRRPFPRIRRYAHRQHAPNGIHRRERA